VSSATYDPVELRRRIAVCFSVGELRALAESLGVGGVAWERGMNEAAREVVRQCERYAGLPALVARLREARPDVEWPEPLASADAAVVPSAASPFAAPIPGVAPPTLLSSPGTLGPAPEPMESPLAQDVGAEAASLRDPYAPPPGPSVIQPPTAAAPRPPAAWPGTTPEPVAAPSRGLDPRILVAVAALMVVAALMAYLAGRASSPTASAPASSASARPAGHPDGPATRASDAIARSFGNLARVCELPSSAGANELVFRRVFERCGPAPPRRAGGSMPASAPGGAPASDAPDTTPAAEPAAARPAAAPRLPRGDAPSGAAPAAKGCMGSCDATHAACRGRCGPEPTESTAYDTYQRCLGRCLSEASHCRLGCR
jgi:hypothetical protein